MGISPLITTIIPTYRRPRLLERAIRSVLRQTYPNFQVCVYDNASGDETAAVVEGLMRQDSRVRYYCHPKNIGAFLNFQHGLVRVQTPFFSFLSDDDILLPEFFQTVLKGFEKFPDVIFSAGATIVMTNEGKVLSVPVSLWEREGYYAPPEGLFEMMRDRLPTWTSILFRKEVIDNVGTLDSDVGAALDLDLELRTAARFPFVISKKPCAIYVNHASSFSEFAGLHAVLPGWLKIINNLARDERIPLSVRTRAEKTLMKNIERMLFWTGIHSISLRDFSGACETARALRHQYGRKSSSFMLSASAKVCERMLFAHRLFLLCRDVRQLWSRYATRNNPSLQVQYGDFARWLS